MFEAAIHAGLWSALPFFAFAGQPPHAQMMLAGAMATMMAGAFLLVLVPLAAAVWVLVLAAAMLWGLHGAGDMAVGTALVLITGYVAVVLTGCLTIERLLSRYIHLAADEARAANRSRCCSRNMRIRAPAGCGRSMRPTRSPMYPRGFPDCSADPSQLMGQSLR